MLIQKIEDIMESIAPSSLAESWDNPGWQIKPSKREIQALLLTIDVTTEVAKEAIDKHVDVIISHHPLFFHEVHSIDLDSYQGKLVKLILQNEIAVWTSHTNLDSVPTGTSFSIARALSLQDIRVLRPWSMRLPEGFPKDNVGKGAIGHLEHPISTEELTRHVGDVLGTDLVGSTSSSTDPLHSLIAVAAGVGSHLIPEALKAGASAMVTSDVKYHEALSARQAGLTVINADHYFAERLLLEPLANMLRQRVSIPIHISAIPTTPFVSCKQTRG